MKQLQPTQTFQGIKLEAVMLLKQSFHNQQR